jgi:hypothetical protein
LIYEDGVGKLECYIQACLRLYFDVLTELKLAEPLSSSLVNWHNNSSYLGTTIKVR